MSSQIDIQQTEGHDWSIGDKLTAFTRETTPFDYDPLHYVFNMCVDGQVVAEASVEKLWGGLDVALFHVEKEHRGKGYGQKLMSAIQDFAKEHDCRSIRLNTPSFQGKGFYEKCGFELAAELPTNLVVNGEQVTHCIYTKTLG